MLLTTLVLLLIGMSVTLGMRFMQSQLEHWDEIPYVDKGMSTSR